jgi:hypothetical protein
MHDDFLHLPYPSSLPTDRTAVTEAFRALDCAQVPSTRTASRTPIAPPREPHRTRAGKRRRGEEDHDEHDRYFRVIRTLHNPTETFLTGLSTIYSSVRENGQEMATELLDTSSWRELFAAWDKLLEFADTPPPSFGPGTASQAAESIGTPTPPRPGDGSGPAARWLLGHQLFFVLIQGTIVGLNCYLQAEERDDASAALAGLTLATAFMRSSAPAIRFASDFDPIDYSTRIRPAMAPPAVAAGFSGLQTRDHAFLVSLFGRLRATLHKRGSTDAAFEEFVDATVGVYEAHSFICARFNGTVLPSLRMAAASQGRSTQPGVEALRGIMRARLFALTGSNRLAEPAKPVAEGTVRR